VGNVNRAAFQDSPAHQRSSTHFKRMRFHESIERGRMAEIGDLPVSFALLAIDRSHVRLAQAHRGLDQGVEDGLKIEGRATDDLEHIGGGGLLLKRFAKLIEQARVLDGDDGLAGETLHQLDLLVGERPRLLTEYIDRTDQLVLLEHRYGNKYSRAAKPECRSRRAVLAIRRGVDDCFRM